MVPMPTQTNILKSVLHSGAASPEYRRKARIAEAGRAPVQGALL